MTVVLTKDFLQSLTPRPRDSTKARIWDGYAEAILSPRGQALFNMYGVTTKLRTAHFLAQICHECSGFTLIYESGDYSAKRIGEIFGPGKHSAAIGPTEAKKLAHNGPALFERAYGLGNPKMARDLGNTQKGDGWRFRGTGIQQLTGRGSHEKYAAAIPCDLDKLCEPLNSLHGAFLEWDEKKCNVSADKDDIKAVTKKINGGYNGLAERRTYLAKAKRLIDQLPSEQKKPKLVDPPKPPEAVEVGDENDNVKELQELLVRAGYVVPIDGKMGQKTEAALAGFQVNHGLPATGKGDRATWETLRGVKPVERPVDEKSIAEKSRTIQLAATLRFWFSLVYRSVVTAIMTIAGYLGFGDESNPLDVAQKASDTADRANDLSSKLGLSFGAWGVVILCALILIGLICFFGRRAASGIIAARIEDAKSGANLSV